MSSYAALVTSVESSGFDEGVETDSTSSESETFTFVSFVTRTVPPGFVRETTNSPASPSRSIRARSPDWTGRSRSSRFTARSNVSTSSSEKFAFGTTVMDFASETEMG